MAREEAAGHHHSAGIPSARILPFLRRLEAEGCIVRLVTLERNYVRLARILSVDDGSDRPNLLLGPPKGFPAELRGFRAGAVRIEIVWEARVKYVFESTVLSSSDEMIRIELPRRVEQLQRRRFPRATPPSGSRIRFLREDEELSAGLADLGGGGALILLDGRGEGSRPLETGSALRKLSLDCRIAEREQRVRVEKALVNRGQGDRQPDFFSVALEFVDILPAEQERLLSLVSQCDAKEHGPAQDLE